jgi:hypothetical protein
MSSLLVIKPEETEALYLEDMSYSFFFFLFSFSFFLISQITTHPLLPSAFRFLSLGDQHSSAGLCVQQFAHFLSTARECVYNTNSARDK